MAAFGGLQPGWAVRCMNRNRFGWGNPWGFVAEWRKSGRLILGKDYIETHSRDGKNKAYAYRIESLEREYRKRHKTTAAQKSQRLSASWRKMASSVSPPVGMIATVEAVERFGWSQNNLRTWRANCPYLGRGLATVTKKGFGRKFVFWSVADLEKLNRSRDTIPADTNDSTISATEAAEKTGLSLKNVLKNKKRRKALGLAATYRRRASGKSGGQAELRFSKESVDRYAADHPRPTFPAGKLTTEHAAQIIGCGRTSVLRWLNSGVLKGSLRKATTRAGMPVWSVDPESVDGVAAIARKIGARNVSSHVLEVGLNGPVKARSGNGQAGKEERFKATDPAVAEVYAFCYNQRATGKSWSDVTAAAIDRFKDHKYSPPQKRQDAWLYAKRHAERLGLPFPPKRIR
jgi:hypothetical protein